jgi:hypothetical protein
LLSLLWRGASRAFFYPNLEDLDSHRLCAAGFHLFKNARKSSGVSARAFSNSPFFWL